MFVYVRGKWNYLFCIWFYLKINWKIILQIETYISFATCYFVLLCSSTIFLHAVLCPRCQSAVWHSLLQYLLCQEILLQWIHLFFSTCGRYCTEWQREQRCTLVKWCWQFEQFDVTADACLILYQKNKLIINK